MTQKNCAKLNGDENDNFFLVWGAGTHEITVKERRQMIRGTKKNYYDAMVVMPKKGPQQKIDMQSQNDKKMSGSKKKIKKKN